MGPDRGGSSVKVSTKRGSCTSVSYQGEGRSHTFFKIIIMRLDKLPKNTGRSLPKGIGKVIIIAFWRWNPSSETSLLMLVLGSSCAVCVAPKFASANFS